MTYFTKEFSEDFILPDNTVATSSQDIDRFLKANNLALMSDYSDEYMKNVRLDNDKAQRKEIFAEVVQQYKKRIWNE
ncbi:MAG: hypothetical protein E7004_00490 [Alphaproteobacteria bacterium]|nr:hypothetical protein [Alphaproteobacteria bacterium]